MDTIRDTESAIYFYETSKYPEDHGGKYLFTCGLLQALIVQQDAVKNIFEALEFNEILWTKTPLKEIRELRNRSTGHPTKTISVFPNASHFISYPTLEKYSFQLMVCEKDKNRFPVVDIRHLINIQRVELAKKLNEIIKKYEKDDKMHKKRYVSDKLEQIFHGINYDTSKLYEGIEHGEIFKTIHAGILLKEIGRILDKFENKLKEREEEHCVTEIYREIAYPMRELVKYFKNSNTERIINHQTAYIFVFYIDKKIEELKNIAIEIDNEYAGIINKKSTKACNKIIVNIINENSRTAKNVQNRG
jgi:hypothetical protein